MNLATVTSTPGVTPAPAKAAAYTAEWTPGCNQSSEEYEEGESAANVAISVLSAAMENLSQVATNAGQVSPLGFQLKTTWDEARDEAGFHNNSSLIAAARDVRKRVNVTVQGYHYSEPQYGKAICDCILCPMKSSIRTYCNEGHNALTTADMRNVLTQHPVRGTTAAVGFVQEPKKTLSVNKIDNFSSYHNFQYEESGLRVWKCYGIGNGKYLPSDGIYVEHQGLTFLQTAKSQGFYDPPAKREV